MISHRYMVVILLLISVRGWGQGIVSAEYFFNSDPGLGNGTPITITPSAGDLTFTTSIPTTSLSQGFHNLAIRVKETGGVWSQFEHRGFYITSSTSDAANLVAAEYFFDADPGVGNGTPIPVTPGPTTNFTIAIPTSSLGLGFHFLAIRTKAMDGKWGLFEGRGFFIGTSATDVPDITAAEYFFDSDPGQGNGTPLAVTPGATTTFIASIPTGSLTPGFHFIAIRTRGAGGKWGIFESRGFYVSPAGLASADIVAGEYFIDGVDPGEGNGYPLSITPGPTINETLIITLSGVPSGARTLSIRVQDADGLWSSIETNPFNVLVCTPPGAPSAIDGSRCNVGPVTLGASGAAGSQVYRWYDDPLAGTLLFTGSSFTTPNLSDTTSYYVNIYDPVTLCESARSEAVANVLNIPQPVISPAGDFSFCEGSSIFLTAPAGYSQYAWSNGQITQQILVTVPGDYAMQVGNGSCTSVPSDTATVDVVPAPSKPGITVAGSSALCAGDSTQLAGPTGFEYYWSTGETSQSIYVQQAGVYFLIVKTPGANCPSLPSDPVALSAVSAITKPIVTVTGDPALCPGGFVQLSAPGGFNYNWSTGATTQSITATQLGSYAVEVMAPGTTCSSPPSDSTAVTEVVPPSKPIVTASGSTTICGSGSVVFSAPGGYEYLWSTGAASQTITISQSGAYSVQVRQPGGTCYSEASDLVPVIVLAPPCSGPVNTSPIIDDSALSTPIEGKVEVDLTQIISDPDNNLDLSSLRVVNGVTALGLSAYVDAAYYLRIDYSGNPFTGIDRVTLEACDLTLACSQQAIDINVVGEIVIFNAITPDGDGYNDFMLIKYVDVVEGAGKNKVTVFNRWGNVVFETNDYDNVNRVFRGESDSGKDLPSGTYFYKIELGDGKNYTGYLTLKR